MARAVTLLTEQYQKQQNVLRLPPATGDLPETGGIIFASPASPTPKPIEHAGHIYQQRVIRSYSINVSALDEEPDDSDKDAQSTPNGKASSATDAASKLASKMAIGSEDLYELLELGEKRWRATGDEIKKSFRRISLIYHPDKISHLGDKAREDSEAHFKSVKKAYDILSDKKKRAAYDSINDIDDSIPTERDATLSAERFFEKFGSCFAINSRWSVNNRVPQLGDDTTNVETVEKFYEFWYSFKSWRDFSFDVEFDTDLAECREEKRWMERQNAKSIKTKKVEENARIRRLVDLAYKHDPRLQRVRAEEKAKKDALKKEKQRQAEERARAEQEREESLKKEEEQRAAEDKAKRTAAKKGREMHRQVLRKSRQRLRSVGRKLDILSSENAYILLEKICMEGTVESIDCTAEALGGLGDCKELILEKAMKILERASSDPQTAVPIEDLAQPMEANDSLDSEMEGSKRPVISADEGTTCSSESSMNETRNTSEDVPKAHWTADEMSLLSKGVTKFPGGTRDRWTKIADFIGSKSSEEVLQKVNENRANKINKVSVNVSAKQDDKEAFERFQEKKKGNPILPSGSKKVSPGGAIPAQPPNSLHFSPKEQNIFESALKRFGALEKDAKWNKVALAVGRSPGECKQRFDELIAYYKAKKQAQ